MKQEIIRTFYFDAAHKIPGHSKCGRLHGHTWRFDVVLEGEPSGEFNFLIDFHDFDKIVNREVVDILDHSYLNDILEMPTSENIANWIFKKLKDAFPENVKLKEIRVYESLKGGPYPHVVQKNEQE